MDMFHAARKSPPTDPSTTAHVVAAIDAAHHERTPFDFWLLDNILPESTIDAILDLPFEPIKTPVFDGRRENNNGFRCHFSAANQNTYPVCKDVVQAFGNPATVAAIEKRTGADLSTGSLRVEYCQDTNGFWLEPHLDLGVKLFTMMLYLSDDPNLHDAGTDIYDASPDHKRVLSAPYERNHGMIFIPGQNTWHGFSKRAINGLRKSVMINYVSPEWRNKNELAYYQ